MLLFITGIFVVVGAFVFIQRGERVVVKKEENKEDVVRLFFNLVDEGRVSEALMMLTPDEIDNESKKQAWGVQFNAFEEVQVVSVEFLGENTYKVILETKMKPEAGLAESVPFYGYGNGRFIRWVELEEVNGVWKIKKIATGP